MSIFFQIDFEVIRTMRSKDFNFGFTENVSKFMILGGNIGKVRRLCKFCKVGLNVKTKLKLVRV